MRKIFILLAVMILSVSAGYAAEWKAIFSAVKFPAGECLEPGDRIKIVTGTAYKSGEGEIHALCGRFGSCEGGAVEVVTAGIINGQPEISAGPVMQNGYKIGWSEGGTEYYIHPPVKETAAE